MKARWAPDDSWLSTEELRQHLGVLAKLTLIERAALFSKPLDLEPLVKFMEDAQAFGRRIQQAAEEKQTISLRLVFWFEIDSDSE